MTEIDQVARIAFPILFVLASGLFLAQLWLLIRARRGKRAEEPFLLPNILWAGALVLLALSGAIGYSPAPVAAGLLIGSGVLLVLAAWTMWGPFRDHMRSVGLWRTPEEKRSSDAD